MSAVADHLEDNTFVFRTDVKSYYASIDHDILFFTVPLETQDAFLLLAAVTIANMVSQRSQQRPLILYKNICKISLKLLSLLCQFDISKHH